MSGHEKARDLGQERTRLVRQETAGGLGQEMESIWIRKSLNIEWYSMNRATDEQD